MSYLTSPAASKTLAILAALGFKAEAISASRPSTGTLYLVLVEAPWLPRPGMSVRVTQPSHLHGFGAEIADINEVERLQHCS
jgi:hypothetical protein